MTFPHSADPITVNEPRESDRSRWLRTWGIALGIAALLVLWMASGLLRSERKDAAGAPSRAPKSEFRVLVKTFEATSVSRTVAFSGHTEPLHRIAVAAEIEGRILDTAASEGAPIAAGAPIARIDTRTLDRRIAAAQALLHQRELEFRAAGPLRARGVITEAELAARRAAMEAARAELASLEYQSRHAVVTAPMDALLERLEVDPGDYVKVGAPIAELVVNDPLIVSGGVSERRIAGLRTGLPASVRLADGRQIAGTVHRVASVADTATRTFTVEVEVPNPDLALRAGMSASVEIPVGEVMAHRIASALLALSDDGVLGVKSVDESGTVRFHAVEILRADGDALYVTGLPERIALITRGQGFVQPGERVAVERADDAQP